MATRDDAQRIKVRVLKARVRHPSLTIAELARVAKCSRRTVYRILQDAREAHEQRNHPAGLPSPGWPGTASTGAVAG